MYDIDDLPSSIKLGRLNEKGVNEVEFDVTVWMTDYPTGELSITYTRSGETDVYPVLGSTGLPAEVSLLKLSDGDLSLTDTVSENILTWKVSDIVTENEGYGSIVIHMSVGNVIIKNSDKTETYVMEGHATPVSAPSPMQAWYDAIISRVVALEGKVSALELLVVALEGKVSALELLHE